MNLLASVLNTILAWPLSQVAVGSMLAANKRLCFELLSMARTDQRMRLASIEGKPWDDQIDRDHTQRMKRIIVQYGWPVESLIGQMGAQIELGTIWFRVRGSRALQVTTKERQAPARARVGEWQAWKGLYP